MKHKRLVHARQLSTFWLLILCFAVSCTTPQEQTNQESSGTLPQPSQVDPVPSYSAAQQAAFEALNTLQFTTQGHLYSTFSGIEHFAMEADTSFTVSSAELLIAMKRLLADYSTDLSTEQCAALASAAVLATDEYRVEQWYGTDFEMRDDTVTNVRTAGTWVLPQVLGRSDVVLIW